MISRIPCAINVIVNEYDEILLLKRQENAHLGAGLWGFPGGRLEKLETPKQGSIRELNEEIGSQHNLLEIAMIGPVIDHYFGGRYEIYLFHYKWVSGEIHLNHEHDSYAWVKQKNYRTYSVVDGTDQDLAYLNIWPITSLNQALLIFADS